MYYMVHHMTKAMTELLHNEPICIDMIGHASPMDPTDQATNNKKYH